MVQFAPQVLKARPYQAGKPISDLARELDLDESKIIKLASNENPLGMSPRAQQRAQQALSDSWLYPDPNGFDLKRTLAERHDVRPESITLGNGSNDILELVASTVLGPGRSAVFSQYAFTVYAQATLRTGAEGIVVPAVEFGHDLGAMAKAVREDTTVIFVANPNNPTGTYLSPIELKKFIEEVPEPVLIVLDEAYNEYLPPEKRYDSIAWVRSHPNVLVTRTFSKAYGLAGLRVGYSVSSPEVSDYINRIRPAFNVSNVAQAAAIGALEDDEFRERTYCVNQMSLAQLSNGFEDLSVPYIRSHGNFILAQFGEAAPQINQYLLKKGVIVRPVGNYGLAAWLRISVGLPEQNAVLLNLLDEVLAQHR
ncbi:MAG TPA: histidinol-phosphate transaminase [Trinickia sp.]|jgi:histidinol-phosphate aminotransferase|uniref:histidinol-phosphate transaminase n=1 Tax=Trinickia sp. TaxID=2571163 RepID=UPI002BCA3C88|nr:histidinol-phosphate transaminase [Trinickia sp.]HVW50008.1 histidinol-phosphate transaminase [Trinickia sp.]